jgi:uncharacterized membrane protein YkvA (DUF1232 family)
MQAFCYQPTSADSVISSAGGLRQDTFYEMIESVGLLKSWRLRVRALKRDTYALYLAARDRRTRWPARLLAAVVLAYAFSPIDLIPDFIPVLGYLDDLVLIPLGLALLLKMIPGEVMADARARADDALSEHRPRSLAAAVTIVAVWLGLAALACVWVWKLFAA